MTLQGRTTVRGRVEFANGEPGGFALVAGGEGIVTADADGNFELTGVPTGRRSIEAAVQEDPSRGIEFTRLGSASVDVIAGLENFVVVRLTPAGGILGVVLDADGNPVPNVDVSIPQQGGFLWVHANAAGHFEFPNLALGDYTVSAPAPPHEDVDVTGILDTLSGSPTSDELEASITRAFEIFTGVNNPLLNGEGQTFNPLDWGFGKITLAEDGRTRFVEVRFLRRGTIAGTVLNGQGVPIGARVRLTGVGPTREGDVGFIIRGELNSDPALGTFSFPGQALAGDFGLQAATPFFPAPISTSGQTSRIDPDRTGIVLQFPGENLVNGRLAGRVLAPDGSLVAGAKVKISFGDLEIHTDATGRFDTQLDLPAFDDQGQRARLQRRSRGRGDGPARPELRDAEARHHQSRRRAAAREERFPARARARRHRRRRRERRGGREAGELPAGGVPGKHRRQRRAAARKPLRGQLRRRRVRRARHQHPARRLGRVGHDGERNARGGPARRHGDAARHLRRTRPRDADRIRAAPHRQRRLRHHRRERRLRGHRRAARHPAS